MSDQIKAVLTADSADLEAKLKRAAVLTGDLSKVVKNAGGALASAFAGSQVLAAVNALRSRIEDIKDTAARLELPIEEVQQLAQVASFSGSSVEALAKAINRAKVAGAEGARGVESYVRQFETLGISAEEFNRMPAVEKLLAISRGFNTAKDDGAAFAATLKILGKGGADLVPMLRGGEAALEDVSRRLRVLSTEDVDSVDTLSDEIELLTNNIQNDLSKALVTVAPQLTGFFKTLAEAAEGLQVFLSPAGAAGKSGGTLGGVDLLRQMDAVEGRMEKIKALQSEGRGWAAGKEIGLSGWSGEIRKPLTWHSENAAEELAVLTERWNKLGAEVRLTAERIREFERLQAAGLAPEEFSKAVAALESRTEETRRAMEAEKELSNHASNTADDLERQEAAATKLAASLSSLKEKVAGRIFDLLPAEQRKAMASADLRGILDGAGVKSVDELRRSVGTATSDEKQFKALQSLDAALDKMEVVKRANAEMTAEASKRWAAWQEAIENTTKAAAASADVGAGLSQAAESAAEEDRARAEENARILEDKQANARALEEELAILRTTLMEGAKKGDQLRRELETREKINQVMEQTPWNKTQATSFVKQLQAAQNAAAQINIPLKDRGDARREANATRRAEDRMDANNRARLQRAIHAAKRDEPFKLARRDGIEQKVKQDERKGDQKARAEADNRDKAFNLERTMTNLEKSVKAIEKRFEQVASA